MFTHIRYPDPLIKTTDTVKVDVKTWEDHRFYQIRSRQLSDGYRWHMSRVGLVTHRVRHHGSFDIVHVQDAAGKQFATRLSNVFIIGKGTKAYISLPRQKGVRLTRKEIGDSRLKLRDITHNKVKWPNFGHRLFPVTLQKTHRPGKKGLSLQQPICCLRSGNIPLPPQPD